MADEVWAGFLDTISGEESVLPLATYKCLVEGARPFTKNGEIQRGFFLELVVTEGPKKNAFASVYINVPEPGNRKAGFWYQKKMAGFGDLTAVYESMPGTDLEGGLEVLCSALIGRELYAEIGPGVGDYSNRNSLGATKPLSDSVAVATTAVDAEVSDPEGESDVDSPGF